MKIFVVGANGQVGQKLVQKLLDQQDEVYAGVRDPKHQSVIKDSQVHYVHLDLTWSVSQIAAAFMGMDAIIFTAGSGGKNLLKVDLDGAVRAMKASDQAGIDRFIMLSAIYAGTPEYWPEAIHDYYIAKHYADEWLKTQSTLDYLILQPVTLTNDKGTGTVSTEATSKYISRENVAGFLAALVHSSLNRKVIPLSDGDTPIAEAVKTLKA